MKKPKTDQQLKLAQLRSRYQQLKQKKAKSQGDVREMLRLKALIAYYRGLKLETVAQAYEVGVKTLREWIKQFEAAQGLRDETRSGRPAKLSTGQQQQLKAIITRHQAQVWTARHVYVLLEAVFRVCYAPKYIPALLRSLGLSYHKAMHYLVKRNEAQRKKWIQETLPALHAQVVQAGWRLFSLDEVGFQTEGTLAYSWGPQGERIDIENYGRHGRVNLIGALEWGTGVFYGVLTSFKVNAQRFRRFLCHLKREMSQDKLILICDNASFHKAKWLKAWYHQQQGWLHVEFLPAYSPDFNPIERLWRWLKTEYIHNECWPSQAALKKHLQRVLRTLPHQTEAIKGVMRQEMERLRVAFERYDTPFPFTLPT